MPTDLLTSPQVARRLGVSARTVHRLVTSKALRPVHTLPGPNGAFLFDAADVEELRIQRGATAEDVA